MEDHTSLRFSRLLSLPDYDDAYAWLPLNSETRPRALAAQSIATLPSKFPTAAINGGKGDNLLDFHVSHKVDDSAYHNDSSPPTPDLSTLPDLDMVSFPLVEVEEDDEGIPTHSSQLPQFQPPAMSGSVQNDLPVAKPGQNDSEVEPAHLRSHSLDGPDSACLPKRELTSACCSMSTGVTIPLSSNQSTKVESFLTPVLPKFPEFPELSWNRRETTETMAMRTNSVSEGQETYCSSVTSTISPMDISLPQSAEEVSTRQEISSSARTSDYAITMDLQPRSKSSSKSDLQLASSGQESYCSSVTSAVSPLEISVSQVAEELYPTQRVPSFAEIVNSTDTTVPGSSSNGLLKLETSKTSENLSLSSAKRPLASFESTLAGDDLKVLTTDDAGWMNSVSKNASSQEPFSSADAVELDPKMPLEVSNGSIKEQTHDMNDLADVEGDKSKEVSSSTNQLVETQKPQEVVVEEELCVIAKSADSTRAKKEDGKTDQDIDAPVCSPEEKVIGPPSVSSTTSVLSSPSTTNASTSSSSSSSTSSSSTSTTSATTSESTSSTTPSVSFISNSDDDEKTLAQDSKWLTTDASAPTPPPRLRRMEAKKAEDEVSETGSNISDVRTTEPITASNDAIAAVTPVTRGATTDTLPLVLDRQDSTVELSEYAPKGKVLSTPDSKVNTINSGDEKVKVEAEKDKPVEDDSDTSISLSLSSDEEEEEEEDGDSSGSSSTTTTSSSTSSSSSSSGSSSSSTSSETEESRHVAAVKTRKSLGERDPFSDVGSEEDSVIADDAVPAKMVTKNQKLEPSDGNKKASKTSQDVKTDMTQSKSKTEEKQSSLSTQPQKTSRHRSGGTENANQHRLPRFGSLPSIVSPKLADEDLEDTPMRTASVGDEVVKSRPQTITPQKLRASSKHKKGEEAEKKAVHTKETSTETSKRPRKFTSSVRLDLVSLNRAPTDTHRTVVSSDSTTSSSTASRYILPRLSTEAPLKQTPLIRMGPKEEERQATIPTASDLSIPRPKNLTISAKSSTLEPQRRRHHETHMGEPVTSQTSAPISPINRPTYITSLSAKRHLNDGQDGNTAYCKRYVYPDGVVFHTTGSRNTSSPTGVASLHRQDSRKSRHVVIPTSPMSSSPKTRSLSSVQPYHAHHHHHHTNGVSIGVGSSNGGLNGPRELNEMELCETTAPVHRRAANMRGQSARPRSLMEIQPGSPQQSSLSPIGVTEMAGMGVEKAMRHLPYTVSASTHRTNGSVSSTAKVSLKSFARKDKKGEENGYVHTRAGSRTRFSTSLEVIEADDYDRRSEKTWAKLTPSEKASIREELNLYKSNEMKVHEDSRQYTRYHR